MCCRSSFKSPPRTEGVQIGGIFALMIRLCGMWASSDDPIMAGLMESSISKESLTSCDILFLADTFHTGLATGDLDFLDSFIDSGLPSLFL